MIALRDLSDVDSCRDVVRLQEAVWGREGDIVPASLLVASARRGGMLIGAFDADRLIGFVWSVPGVREGMLTQWSHMLAVLPEVRSSGVGQALKSAQRDRALSAGVDLIEWTFDPLQAPNAHLNIARLGCVVTTYLVDAYGAMSGPLHRGTPTDRLIAEWHLRAPHVERRLARSRGLASGPIVRSAEVLDAPLVLAAVPGGGRSRPGPFRGDVEARRVLVQIPADFIELQRTSTELALEWRLAVRQAFLALFARGYRVVDFWAGEGGTYLVEKTVDASR